MALGKNSSKTNITVTLVTALAAIVVLPILILIVELFTPLNENFWHLFDYLLLEYIINSLWIIIGVGALSFIFGVGTAFFVVYYDFFGKKLLAPLLVLPLAAPSYIIAYLWSDLLDTDSDLQLFFLDTFGFFIPEITNLFGMIVVLSLTLYPYVYLLTRSAFKNNSHAFVKVGKNFGCSDWQIFYKILLPLARPVIIASLSIVIMEALADYGVAAYYGVSVFTTGIFKSWLDLGDINLSAKLSLMLLGLIFVLIYIEKASRKQAKYYNKANNNTEVQTTKLTPVAGLFVFALCAFPVVFGFIVPVVVLANWALASFDSIQTDFIATLGNSFFIASVSAILITILALLFAFIKRNYPHKTAHFLCNATNFGYAMPGAVVSIGVILMFGYINNYLPFNPYDGIFALLLAYSLRFLVMANNSFTTALEKIPTSIDKSGQSLGFSNAKLWVKVHLPLMNKNILIAMLLVFIEILKELPATLILRPFNFDTLAIKAFELASDERLADSSMYALSIILMGIIPVILVNRGLNK